ncbi:MAG: Rrf2 family transcriptional regulator [bacterium]|nr:Rrf2 family transcriptional regulator [bacterium]
MISTKGRYALRLMIDIAIYEEKGYVSLKDSSSREDLSIKYLEQVASILTRAGLILSFRGNNGGYKLSRNPKDYKIGEILRAAEGSLAPVACLECSNNYCNRKDKCTTIDFWDGFNKVINDYVDNITLEDLVDKAKGKLTNDYSI